MCSKLYSKGYCRCVHVFYVYFSQKNCKFIKILDKIFVQELSKPCPSIRIVDEWFEELQVRLHRNNPKHRITTVGILEYGAVDDGTSGSSRGGSGGLVSNQYHWGFWLQVDLFNFGFLLVMGVSGTQPFIRRDAGHGTLLVTGALKRSVYVCGNGYAYSIRKDKLHRRLR